MLLRRFQQGDHVTITEKAAEECSYPTGVTWTIHNWYDNKTPGNEHGSRLFNPTQNEVLYSLSLNRGTRQDMNAYFGVDQYRSGMLMYLYDSQLKNAMPVMVGRFTVDDLVKVDTSCLAHLGYNDLLTGQETLVVTEKYLGFSEGDLYSRYTCKTWPESNGETYLFLDYMLHDAPTPVMWTMFCLEERTSKEIEDHNRRMIALESVKNMLWLTKEKDVPEGKVMRYIHHQIRDYIKELPDGAEKREYQNILTSLFKPGKW